MAQLFLQSLTIGDLNAPLTLVASVAYIERMNMTCPKLILKLLDKEKLFQDDYGLNDGVVLELVLGDVDARGEALFKDRFVVGANWSSGGKLTVEAIQADVWRTKQPERKPVFFSDKTPLQILSEVFSGLKLDVDEFVTRRTYHVQSGSTIAAMLRQMAADYGAAMWVCRGTLYMKKLAPKMKGKEGFRFEYQRNNSSNPMIISYERYQTKAANVDSLVRSRISWDMAKGIQVSRSNTNAPIEFVSRVPEAQLDNANLFIDHSLECTMAGNGDFEPFKNVSLELNRLTPEQILDESVDQNQLIIGVRHFQEGFKYICAVELGGVENEAG